MDKKKLTIIFFIAIIFILVIVIFVRNKNKNLNKNTNEVENIIDSVTSNYIENIGIYKIYDKNGNLITTTMENSVIDFYKENPDYRANPPTSPNAMNESFENEYNY